MGRVAEVLCGWCISGHHGSCRDGFDGRTGYRCLCACRISLAYMSGVRERTAASVFVSAAELAAHPWAFRCEIEGCYYGVCADSQEIAEREQWTHGCPRVGDKMIGKSIIERAWDQIDAQTDEIYALMKIDLVALDVTEMEAIDLSVKVAKAAANGKAEILALLMAPIFSSSAEIAQESARRYAARQRGDLTYQTQGLGSRRQEVTPRG